MSMTHDQLLAASSRVALAAFLHDLGKFAERAGFEAPSSALDAHVQLYCPFKTYEPGGTRGFHTHKHAAYTGLAFDVVEKNAPDLIQGDMAPFASRSSDGDITDSMINAAAAHHKPETFLQWVIATADRVASGFEREEFEDYNSAEDKNPITGRNHYQARQWTLFESIQLNDSGLPSPSTKNSDAYRYRLLAMSPRSIFPVSADSYEPNDDASAKAEYAALWQKFLHGLTDIPASHRQNWPLWLDHFDTAWQTFTHAIPSATAGFSNNKWAKLRPDVSLYDHSKTAAAVATALWRWHQEAGQTDAAAAGRLSQRQDWHEDKLLLIQGDFFGIQDFVFADGSQTNKAAAKLLRGRSFQVSLFTELAALKVLEALSLPPTSQITNAAGKFLILAPNTETARGQLERVREEINNWFLKHSFGMAGLGLVGKTACCNDFKKGKAADGHASPFKKLLVSLFADLERAKLQRFALTGQSSPVIDVSYAQGACQYNEKMPADRPNDAKGDSISSAALSRDQILLGDSLTRLDRILVVRDASALTGNSVTRLEVPLFGYAVAFTGGEDATGKFGSLARQGALVRCWDFSLPENLDDTLWHGYARRYINAYVPRFTETDLQTRGKYVGLASDVDTDDVRFDAGKTLNHIACEDRTCPTDPDKWQGQVALMTLKGDVDNLGAIFQQGLQEPTFAKMAALSRQMNAFFALWLPAVCRAEFPNVYTVFAGGDDFFLIGPWRSTQQLAARMAVEFQRFVANNKSITFSAGMVMTKPGLPMHTLSSQAEDALDAAKSSTLPDVTHRKNAAVVFGERVRWPEWGQVEAAQMGLERVRDAYDLSTGYVYGLLNLIDLASDTANPEHAMWRSRFAYRTRRYVVDKLDEAQRPAAQADLAKLLGDDGIAKLGTRFRIPLFNHFYRQR